jgi:hypothetical protein
MYAFSADQRSFEPYFTEQLGPNRDRSFPTRSLGAAALEMSAWINRDHHQESAQFGMRVNPGLLNRRT